MTNPTPLASTEQEVIERVAQSAAEPQIAEGIGAILRKFCDSPESKRAREYLHKMPQSDWDCLVSMLASTSTTAALASLRPGDRLPGGLVVISAEIVEFCKPDRVPEVGDPRTPACGHTDLWEYHRGVSGEGEHAYTWSDKKHRLVYDLTRKLGNLRAWICAGKMFDKEKDTP